MALPEQGPERGLVEFASSQLGDDWGPLAFRLETVDDRQRHLALWIIAIETMTREAEFNQMIDGLQLLAFGIDTSPEATDMSLVVTAYVLPEALEVARVQVAPGLLVPGEDHVERIRVRAEAWDLTLHARVDLRYGTLACWVKPVTGGDAILTVRHAVFSGGFVLLDDGSRQPVLWYAPNCLDAAVVSGPLGRALRPLPTAVPLQGDSVLVLTKRRGERRTVKYVGPTYGTTTAAIPHLFLLDQPLQSGDSGSLVRLTSAGHALGIYIGALPTSRGMCGLCQGLHQLDRLFTNAGSSSGLYVE
jgi:hypothetical protein